MSKEMNISKSSRHSKITGDFGETLILYWLSKYGFECALVDHTGIDIIAKNPHTNEVMGISVKSRCRNKGAESEYVSVNAKNFKNAQIACSAFNCVPYFAIVVDAGEIIRAFILSMEHYFELFPLKQTGAGWKMADAYLDKYANDSAIMSFEFHSSTKRWWGNK